MNKFCLVVLEKKSKMSKCERLMDSWMHGQMPDEFEGTGIRVNGSASVTIKNAVVKGYKVAVMGTDVPDIHIFHSDFSYNWRQRLKSTIERESNDDWMSYHNNEADEWLRFGAAVYLRRADRARIEQVTVTGGENGLMLTEVELSAGPVVFAGDLIPGCPWVHLPITMGYDRFPERLIEEKERLLVDLCARGGRLFFTHDPETALGRVGKDERGEGRQQEEEQGDSSHRNESRNSRSRP